MKKRAMVLRLDERMMSALEAAADAARISREGFVRDLLVKRLEVSAGIGAQRPWSPKYGDKPADVRIARGRAARGDRPKKKSSPVRQNVAQLRRRVDKKRAGRKAGKR